MSLISLVKRSMFLAAVPVVGLVSAGPALAAVTFGPSRPTFTWLNTATYITFNSITDNPVFGDERYFLKTRDLNSATTAYSTSTPVTDNEDVVMEIYFHNNAASNLNLVATGTTARFALPSGFATTQTPTAYISANNSNPGSVWATADLTASTPFSLSYEPGTAKLYTNYVSGVAVSDSVVTSGAPIGTNGTDGRVPGCGQYSGYVTIRAKVTFQTPTPPTPQPPTPVTPTTTTKVLPNTGAGDVLGVFAGASAAGTAAHMAVTARRNRR